MQIQQVLITGQNQAELRGAEAPVRTGTDWVRVKTEWTFISTGTELAIYTGTERQALEKGNWCSYPWNSGYANVGRVMELGEDVTRCAVGDRIFTFASHASEVVVRNSKFIVQVPDDIAPDVAAASRMAGVAGSAAVMADLGLHPTVVVYGLGAVGNLAAQTFQALGARVIGVDPVAARRELAQTCGIPETLGASGQELLDALRTRLERRGADIVVDATGLTPVIAEAIDAVRDLGQLILLGSPRAPHQADLTDFVSKIHLRYITVRGALEWAPPTYAPTNSQGGPTRALISLEEKQKMIFDWIRAGRMAVEPLITHRLPPQRIREAYEGLLHSPETHMGVALDWRGAGAP